MQVIISARHLQTPDSLRRFIDEQFSRLTRFEPRLQRAEVTLVEEKTRRRVEARLSVARGGQVRARAEAEEFRTAVDRVVDKLTRQLKKSRSRRRDRKAPGRDSDLELDRTA